MLAFCRDMLDVMTFAKCEYLFNENSADLGAKDSTKKIENYAEQRVLYLNCDSVSVDHEPSLRVKK